MERAHLVTFANAFELSRSSSHPTHQSHTHSLKIHARDVSQSLPAVGEGRRGVRLDSLDAVPDARARADARRRGALRPRVRPRR